MSEPTPQQMSCRDGSTDVSAAAAKTSTMPAAVTVSLPPQQVAEDPPMTNEWHYGLCGCFGNIALCAITFFVPCVTYGEIAKVLGKQCLTHGLLFIVPILNCILWVGQRGELRKRRGIMGTAVNDCCIILCCSCCALTQEGQEAKLMEAEEQARQTATTTITLQGNVQDTGGSVTVVYQPPQSSGQQLPPSAAKDSYVTWAGIASRTHCHQRKQSPCIHPQQQGYAVDPQKQLRVPTESLSTSGRVPHPSRLRPTN